MNLTSLQRQKIATLYPELRDFLVQKATNDLLSGLFSQIKMMKGDTGEQGIQGKEGYTPIKGKDYFTDNEVSQIISYISKSIKPAEDGKDYVLTSQDKKEIARSIEVPIVEKIIEKTEVIREVMPKLDVSMVKGAISKKELEAQDKKVLDGMARVDGRIKLIDQRWGSHGGGLSKVSTDSTLTGLGTPASPLSVVSSGAFSVVTTASTIDDSNVTFVFTAIPVLLNVNGAFYQQTGGAITWSNVGTTITISSAVGSGGTIWGIK